MDTKNISNEILIADLMLRTTVMEKILLEKNIITQEELDNKIKIVLEKLNASIIKEVVIEK